jgi:hypothetical protein
MAEKFSAETGEVSLTAEEMTKLEEMMEELKPNSRIQQPKLKPEVKEPFKSGDRFQQEMFDINGRAVMVRGTVLHRREMYGASMGGTYMVKYDNPTPTIRESLGHNAYGDDMLRL